MTNETFSRGLKADLHLHTCEGLRENYIAYNAFKLIDAAVEKGYQVLSVTNHDTVTYSDYLRDYARERGILLIPGVELTLHGKHVLAYTPRLPHALPGNVADLENLKHRGWLLVAPHPFFPAGHSLGRKFFAWQHLFDAVEFCHFYTDIFDFNRRARESARSLGLPMLGTSDSHLLCQLNTTYSIIYAEKETEAVFEAVKQGELDIVTSPLRHADACRIFSELFVKHTLQHVGTACLCGLSLLMR